jgi:preprotein translocase subunit SecE
VSTRQQDSGPANPVKRLGPRPAARPATPDGSTRPLPPRPAVIAGPTTSPVAKVVARETEEANDPISRIRRALNETVAEVRKVTWPNRNELRNLTIVVIGLSAFVGLTLGLLDAILALIVQLVTGTATK